MNAIALAQEAFAEVDRIAGIARQSMDINGCEVIVDGSMYSPSDRALRGGEEVYHHGTEEEWDDFCAEVEELIDAYADHGFHLGWEEGMLCLYGPQFTPDDI